MSLFRLAMAALSLAMYAVIELVVFFIAGTANLPYIWATLSTQLIAGLIGVFTLDEDLMRERFRPRGKDEDPLAPAILSILLLAIMVLSALDAGRWHLSQIPAFICIIANIFQTIGWLGFLWAMKVNAFFSSAIRLQPDRGQYAISDGPYRFMRHPGYAFASLAFLTQGLSMGSWLAVAPALIVVLYLLYRTQLEEKMLREGLPGYHDYAERVRYRWLPGVW
jgi:protein-S-isoprenylcysteine O-methyltransferase Ste14